MADSKTDSEAEAARLALVPTQPTEIAPVLCSVAGCDSVARRSDGRCARHSRFQSPATAATEAREILKTAAPAMAEAVLQAARVAAAEGNHKPAAWALLHGRAVEPVAQHAAPVAAAVQVIIGVRLPGLPAGDPSPFAPEIVEGESETLPKS